MAALHARCFSTPAPWTAAAFASLLDDRSVFACVRLGGFALARAAADEGELLTLAVAPDARRRGTGRALLAAVEAEARSRGAQALFLEVAAENDPARALYASAGYHEAGRRRAYFRRPDGSRCDAIVLIRRL